MDDLIVALTVVATLGAALMAGLFYFASLVLMPSLGRLEPAEGIRAMQSVNVVIITPLFLLVFMGEAVLSLALAVLAVARLDESGSWWLLAGSLVYLIGCMLLTFGFHIPRNNALDKAVPESAAGQQFWARYLREWTAGNHVRALACLLATAAFALALRYVA